MFLSADSRKIRVEDKLKKSEKKRTSKNKEKIHEKQKRVRYVYIRKPKEKK